ncbi:hypothetical protein M9458_056933, partial [Cirrhinus mrigala]
MLFEDGRTAEAEDWCPKTREHLKKLNDNERPEIKNYVQIVPVLSNVSTEQWHHYIRIDKCDAGE